MAINFNVNDVVIIRPGYIAHTLSKTPTLTVRGTLTVIGEIGIGPGTVLAIGNVDGKSFIQVVPTDTTLPGFRNGQGIILYFDSDLQLNNTFEISTAVMCDNLTKKVLNDSGITITKGQIIRITGLDTTTQLPTVALASAAASATAIISGIMESTVTDGNCGSCLVEGSFQGIDTGAMVAGEKVFLSDTPGAINNTSTAGTIPGIVGRVYKAGTDGAILIRGEHPFDAMPGMQGTTGIQGLMGMQGTTGIRGTTGLIGATGTMGLTGIQGGTGIKGTTGMDGETGITGGTGIQGNTGTGTQGGTGIQGLQGATGIIGIQGDTGIQGGTGIQGNTGTGVQGDTGIQGNTGTGVQGGTGIQGIQGNTGTGVQGATGVVGIQGATGVAGIQGDTGIQGNTGFQGDTGIQGNTGTGIQGGTGVAGIQGGTGVDGIQGGTGIQGNTGAGLQGGTGTSGTAGSQGGTGITGNTGIGSGGLQVLATVNVQLTATGVTGLFPIYSVPGGTSTIIQAIVMRLLGVDTITTEATISAGWDTSSTDVFAPEVTTAVTAVDDMWTLDAGAKSRVGTAGQTLIFGATGMVGNTGSAAVDVIGYEV